MNTNKILTTEDRYNLLTGNVPMLFNRFLTQQFKINNIGLTREQWSILTQLWKEDGCSQQVLADLTFRDKPSTTRLIDNLEKEEYIVRKPHPTDRRQNLIFLTDKGKEIESKVLEVVNLCIDQATINLTIDQILMMKETFQQIRKNIINHSL